MKHVLVILVASLLMLSCGNDDGPKAEDMAMQAAKAYYDQLLNGDYDSFVAGTLRGDSVPHSYKSQLLLNARMFVEEQGSAHQGVKTVVALSAHCDTLRLSNGENQVTADAFLQMVFGDGQKEEVVVPMILENNIWYMR